MKLDKRINNEGCIYNCFSTEQAKIYLSEQGYFTDFIENFSNLDSCVYSELVEINPDSILSYKQTRRMHSSYYRFFLPERFIKKEKEKKYRPYTLDEFLDVFSIGQPITFRNKEYKFKKVLIFSGYETLSSGNAVINMGTTVYTPQELFDVFELQKSNEEEWQPFGVEVEETMPRMHLF